MTADCSRKKLGSAEAFPRAVVAAIHADAPPSTPLSTSSHRSWRGGGGCAPGFVPLRRTRARRCAAPGDVQLLHAPVQPPSEAITSTPRQAEIFDLQEDGDLEHLRSSLR
jgi:hypothetical protein